jgi:hypothetical protein
LNGLDPHDILEFQTQDADHILETLRAVEVFAEVAYADSKASAAARSVSIKPYYLPLQPHCDGGRILVVFFSLGILPGSCTRDRGIYFDVMDRKIPPFQCPWPQSALEGWFPVALATGLGSYERQPNHDAFLRHVRACVAEQSELFRP